MVKIEGLVYLMRGKEKEKGYRKPKVMASQRRWKQEEGNRKGHRDQPRVVGMEDRDTQGCLREGQPRSVGDDIGFERVRMWSRRAT